MKNRGHSRVRVASAAARRGTTLVELLVSIPLAMTLAVAAAALLVRLAHTARGQSSALASARELRHATRVLASDLESLGGRDVHVVSDTLLQFVEQLGVLTLCDTPESHALIAAAPRGSGDLWVGTLRAGDELRLWRPDAPQRPPVRSTRMLVASPVALPPAVCGTDSVPQRRWRIVVGDSIGQGAAGTPVSAHRDVRYRHYRSGTAWWLGRQSRDGNTWETIQPVAGPVRPPASRGVTLTARDPGGRQLHIGVATTDTLRERIALVEVTVAMNRRTAYAPGRTVDSVALLVPLRADAFRRR